MSKISLFDLLLNGITPMSEIFIDQYVQQFVFINSKMKPVTFIELDEIYSFTDVTKKKTKNGKCIFNIMNNQLPTYKKTLFKTSAKKAIVEWKFDRYLGLSNKGISISRYISQFDIHEPSISNIDIIHFLFESFNENIKEHVVNHIEIPIVTRIYYYLSGIKYWVCDDILFIYPHFILNV